MNLPLTLVLVAALIVALAPIAYVLALWTMRGAGWLLLFANGLRAKPEEPA